MNVSHFENERRSPIVDELWLVRHAWIRQIVVATSKEHVDLLRDIVDKAVIARDEQHVMTESLDRRRFVASEMPQAFQTSVISAAYDQCTIEDFEHGTECLLLAMKYVGVRATVLDGNPDLWKVTYKKDLLAAEGVIKERLMRIKVIGADRQEDVAGAIRTALQGHQLQLADGPVGNHTLPQPSSFGDLTSPTAPAVNTFILLHADLTRVDSAEKLSAVQREHLPVAPRPQLIDFTFLHIFLMTDEADITEKQAALLKVVMQLASEGRTKNQQIFGILAVCFIRASICLTFTIAIINDDVVIIHSILDYDKIMKDTSSEDNRRNVIHAVHILKLEATKLALQKSNGAFNINAC
nr:hypothetical protein BaRGS_022338 [Batillaria attramentaria]